MVYIHGFIDIIIRRSALDRNPIKDSQFIIEKEHLTEDHYDNDLVCVAGGMNPIDAESAVRFYEKEYGIKIFDLTDPQKPVAKDGVIINGPFGPTTKCDWIQALGYGWAYVHPLLGFNLPWNAEHWRGSFRSALKETDILEIQWLRELEFSNTQAIVCNGGYVLNGKTIYIPDPSDSVEFYSQIKDLNPGPTDKMKIWVLNEDCLKTARDQQRRNPLVLNIANDMTPGGGAEHGYNTQEAGLFRSSNYHRTLYKIENSAYPMNSNYGGIYSPNVTVFRGLESDGYPLLKKPFLTNFVAVAPVYKPELSQAGTYTEYYRKRMENKIRTILNIAVKYGHKVLILSAFGCGEYGNPPRLVAKLFKMILNEPLYRTNLEDVYFSIKTDYFDLKYNFACFKEVFENDTDSAQPCQLTFDF